MKRFDHIITVSLNPAIDRVVEVPDFRVGVHLRGRRLTRYPAGKAVNVARTIASLGQPCTVTGFVGQAQESDYRKFLSAQGTGNPSLITCRLVPVVGHTRENITVVDPRSPDADTHIVEQGFTITEADHSRLRETIGELVAPGRLFVFSGSLPEGMTTHHFEQLLQFSLDGGSEVAVDASGNALRTTVKLPIGLIKPNRQELAELTNQSLENHAELLTATKQLAQTVRWILLSAGAEGAILISEDSCHHAVLPIDQKTIVGTVGCGDVLLGGFLAGLQLADHAESGDTSPPAIALRRAVAAATLAATRLTREIDLVAVEALEADVEITEANS